MKFLRKSFLTEHLQWLLLDVLRNSASANQTFFFVNRSNFSNLDSLWSSLSMKNIPTKINFSEDFDSKNFQNTSLWLILKYMSNIKTFYTNKKYKTCEVTPCVEKRWGEIQKSSTVYLLLRITTNQRWCKI